MKPTRILAIALSALALLGASFGAASASAAFGLKAGTVDAQVLDENGETVTQAGAHPFSVGTEFELNTELSPRPSEAKNGVEVSSEAPLRHVKVEAPAGLVGNPTATPRCTMADFNPEIEAVSGCPDSSQVGIAITHLNYFGQPTRWESPIYSLEPQQGQPALFGFKVFIVPTFAVPSVRSEGDYGLDFNVIDVDRTMPVTGNEFTFWGVPADSAHDDERGQRDLNACSDGTQLTPKEVEEGKVIECPSDAPEKAFLTSPTDCVHGPFLLRMEVQSWAGHSDSEEFVTHDDEGNPSGVTRCDRVPFEPSISAMPTTENAESPTGLDFELRIPDAGLLNPDGIAQSHLKHTVVKLPEGVTANPSSAEGLGVCTPAQYAREQADTFQGEGCPNSSKIGTVQIQSPLLEGDEQVEGALYLGQPDDPTTRERGAENPFDSLLSIYIVARVRERGVVVKLEGKVEPDPRTGQLTTSFENLPQLPFTSFKLHFREGARAPLVSAPTCGRHVTEAALTPYSEPAQAVVLRSTSLILNGVGGGPCPQGGVPPFDPGFAAGSINNNAKSYTPFDMYLTRKDGEQNMTKFSSTLPPGVLGKLAGVAKCSNAAIATAPTRNGREELAAPSCPAASQIGRVVVGAGVGSVLTYVEGKVYLAGRYNKAPLSVVVITPAVAGPFDVGTVVTREALTLNPETAEVEVDGSRSDPIPHILKGIPLKVRDLRVHVDRPNFILNPTSCDPSSARATLFGSYLDVFSPADDVPANLSTRFQASNCRTLGFKPKLQIKLIGGTKRGAHPALKATLKARPNDANIGSAVVTLPRSAFLDQSHIRTICTRVQFAADKCPNGSIYGTAKAWTPLLEEPIEGPVYMRSSNHKLPDLVASLQGLVEVNVVGRIDSFKGGLRSNFESVPDAPVSRFVLEMQGGSQGLVINSRNLCAATNRAIARFTGQNGKLANLRPVVQARCGKARKKKP